MSKSKLNAKEVLKDVDEIFSLLEDLYEGKKNLNQISNKTKIISEKLEEKYKDHLDPEK